ncbi:MULTISPECIES: hypothetical protein [unclassified Exiguobacterium]|uniref:hypothetical protein n=1 Tax=unclassified Exiguobacterium TaxID=2644629 RepID=UPI001BE9EB84|nr:MULTISPECIES: hypothetical protein [unclassified Exiguobacterium]
MTKFNKYDVLGKPLPIISVGETDEGFIVIEQDEDDDTGNIMGVLDTLEEMVEFVKQGYKSDTMVMDRSEIATYVIHNHEAYLISHREEGINQFVIDAWELHDLEGNKL